MSYARKAADLEPGRCRRTDGKKWKCSKESCPDSKCCDRHMHKGTNRSRKLVELSLATSSASAHEFPSKDLPPPLRGNHRRYEGATCRQPKWGFDLKQVDGSCFRSVLPEEKDRHWFVLGSDLGQEKDVVGLEKEEERQKLSPFHCFFEELLLRNKASWMDRAQQDSFSKTQFSISVPAANHEISVSASQCFNAPNLTTRARACQLHMFCSS